MRSSSALLVFVAACTPGGSDGPAPPGPGEATDSSPPSTTSADSTPAAPTADSAPPTPAGSWTLHLGEPVDLSEPGDLRDSHAVGAGHGEGFLVGWTAEVPGGGTKSTALRLTGLELDGIVRVEPTLLESEAPDLAPLQDGETIVGFTDIVANRAGLRRITATGTAGPVVWLDGAEAPRMPHAVDLAAAPDGSVWALWSETLWTVTMEEDDFAEAPDGRFRLAHLDANGQLLGPVEQRWPVAPGGKHPPAVEVFPDGTVVCAVSERASHDQPANLILERVDDGRRVTVSTPGRDGSRPNMAVDDAGRLAVVWREGAITDLRSHVAVYDADLQLLAGPHPLEPDWTSDRPTVAAHPDGWLVAWEKPFPIDSEWTGHRELRVRLLSPDGTTWRSETTQFASDDRRRRPAVARNGDHSLLLFEQGPNDDTFTRAATLGVEPLTR